MGPVRCGAEAAKVGEEARSDVALAIAAAVFGRLLLGSLSGGSGVVGVILDAAVVLLLTAVVPVLLARTRGDGARALGLGHGGTMSGGVAAGLLLAVPVAASGMLAMASVSAGPAGMLLGRLSGSALQLVPVLALSLGAFVLYVFIALRGPAAFPRSPVWSLTRLLRTFGMAATGLALVTGLLRVPLGASLTRTLGNAAALAVLVLVADRMIPTGRAVPRLAVIVPAALALYLHVTAFGLLAGLQAGALAAGLVTVMATIALAGRGTSTLVPLVLAVHIWPTCLSPLALARGLC
jgi:hypothetical protein